MASRVSHLERSVNRWLTIPEANAAGRLGLYRIIYAVSALMYALSAYNYAEISTVPTYNWRPVAIIAWVNSIPSADVLNILSGIYIISLVFVLFGLWTRGSTLMTLVSGTLFSSMMFSFGKIDHADTFMRVYIPAVMLFASWGKLYSVDTLLAQRRGALSLNPREDSLRFSWPILFLFWMLCIFFMMSGVIKAVPPGQWIVDPDLMRKFMLEYNSIDQPVYIRHVLAQIPLLPTLLLWGGLLFETCYPLAVINKHWRTLYVSSTVFFHLTTGILLGIAFDATLFLYILFFDLWGLFDRFVSIKKRDRLSGFAHRIPLLGWLGMVAVLSLALLLSFHSSSIGPLYPQITALFSRYVWYIVVPIATYGIFRSLPKVVHPIVRRFRQRRQSATLTGEATSSPV